MRAEMELGRNASKNVTLPALRFLATETEHICRLCFSTTDIQEFALDDSMKLQKSYIDETITFMDMFEDLNVLPEPSLPQVLCENCATMTINSYLFKKLCQYSNEQWNYTLQRLNTCLNLTETIGNNLQSVYLLLKDHENVVYTTRKGQTNKSKKTSLDRLKKVLKVKQPNEKEFQKNSTVICEECGVKFSSNRHLLRHMKVHSDIKYPCPQCPKSFTTQMHLDIHAERVHYARRLQCPKCTKRFSTDRMLKHHNQLYHVAAICKLCFVQLPSKKDLRTHLDNHNVNKCPRCNKSFHNKHTFKCHIKICGNIEERQLSFFCDICDKGYARKNGLRTHMKTDHGFGKVLTCDWCDKKFDAVSRLRNHQVKHTRERKFHCNQCGGKFVTRAALIYHVRLHTGEKPFPCDLCNESFLSASRRMEHKRRKHFGPTKECHVCHVKFVTGFQLKKHVQRHFNPLSKLFVPEDPYAKYNAENRKEVLSQSDSQNSNKCQASLLF